MKKIVLPLTALLVACTFVSIWFTRESGRGGEEATLPPVTESQTAADIGGPFALTDQNGAAVRDADFRGRVMLVFFGFTHCPDICPVTLATLSSVMELLGDRAAEVAPVLITVDPDRDTPQIMKEYLSNFDERITGLTGTKEQIAQVADAYKAYFANAGEAPSGNTHDRGHDDNDMDHDAVNHSGLIYLMGRDGKYVRHFSHDAADTDIADAVKAYLQ